MPRRPEPQTKDRILAAARALMLEKSYSAATVDEICARAGVTKGAFFHYFDSKEALGEETVRFSYAKRRRVYEEVREKDPVPSGKRLQEYMRALVAATKADEGPKGCLMGNLVQELYQTSPRLREACAAQLGDWQALLAEDFAAEAKAGATAKGVSGDELAALWLAVFEGAIILGKARQEPLLVPKLLDAYRRLVLGAGKDQR